MTELGSRLKEARESKGYSLEELQGLTKIQKRYLQGIEEGDYSMMPGAFYVRAFIKQYAEAVGLDAEELFETYSKDIPSNHDDNVPSQLSRVKTRGPSKKSSAAFRFIPTAVMTIFVIGIFVLAYYLVQTFMASDAQEPAENEEVQQEEPVSLDQPEDSAEDQENSPESDSVDTAEEPVEAEQPPEEPETPPLTIESTGTEGETTNFQVTSTEGLTVTINTNTTWLGITDQSGKQLVGEEISGTYTFDAAELDWFRLRIGSVPGTTVEINGEQVEFGLTDVTPQNMVFQVQNPS
ncbi:helix-turn-helix domain-containing protein [Jeotgalibacillus terrae]|uniref:RodZ domain-containing protein n=1 Tax=Jeotgalibacillus terrae TaxID=587735 RepID=A0ABW5ZQ36_9BACL|nr:RodZ domain-containing protein [Jeotgalibacillus terrae]MBM7579925.1 cytoskeletal protein RodZ [Jeotgalibacillus terrae]